ncbi:MAG: amino acid--tRNA ligase-related protein, partial [Candidatus Absconditabacterales bacterium]
MYRTHTCGELTAKQAGKQVTICGRVNKVRNLGGMTFIDLRDRYGITQVTFDPAKSKLTLPEIKSEYVLQISGEIIARPANMINKEMSTGDMEIYPNEIKVLSVCKELPFSIDHENPVGEEIRLEYRYLDLRRQGLKNTIINRHKLYMETMKFFDAQGFLHLETPTFIKNTPEGSREFVVPARFEPGRFFVLPQSPQQHKQMLMVAGFDKYFQLARCYRDEDPRGDRQPEFTQVDFEMSFIEQEDVLQIIHDYFVHITKTLYLNKTIKADPFPVLTRDEAMNSYGSDKPELRTTELEIKDATQR